MPDPVANADTEQLRREEMAVLDEQDLPDYLADALRESLLRMDDGALRLLRLYRTEGVGVGA